VVNLKKILNLGCGMDIRKGGSERWVNCDVKKMKGVNVVCDLNKYPWPFKKNEFDGVYCKDVLEHLDNTIKVMEEIHRICKNGAIVNIVVPYYASKVTFLDPTHKRGFTENSFDYFCEGRQYSKYNFYTKARFKILGIKFITYGKRRFIPFKRLLRQFLNNIVDILKIELKVIK
jgi:SAM-dependent methyltransferase